MSGPTPGPKMPCGRMATVAMPPFPFAASTNPSASALVCVYESSPAPTGFTIHHIRMLTFTIHHISMGDGIGPRAAPAQRNACTHLPDYHSVSYGIVVIGLPSISMCMGVGKGFLVLYAWAYRPWGWAWSRRPPTGPCPRTPHCSTPQRSLRASS